MYKSRAMEKFDAHMPSLKNSLHSNLRISDSCMVGAKITYRCPDNEYSGRTIGVQKRAWSVSGMGMWVDMKYIGKGDDI